MMTSTAPLLTAPDQIAACAPTEASWTLSGEIVVIDMAVADWERLRDAAAPAAQVLVVGAGQDGLALLAEALNARDPQFGPLTAIHLIGHGEPGVQHLGACVLDVAALGTRADLVSAIGAALGADGALFLHGCAVRAGSAGDWLLAGLAALTGPNVAAARLPVGNGHWVLDHVHGQLPDGTALDRLAASGFSGTLTTAGPNEAPTLTTTASTAIKGISGSGDPIKLFDKTAISTVEPDQALVSMTLTVTGVTNGTKEFLTINGSDVALANGTSLTAHGYSYAVTQANGTATVTVRSSTQVGITADAMASLVDGISYKSTGRDVGNRTIAITELKDDGGTADGGHDTASLSVAATLALLSKPELGNTQTMDLTFVEYLTNGMPNMKLGGFGNPLSIVMSADGKFIYAGGQSISQIYQFSVNAQGGDLNYAGKTSLWNNGSTDRVDVWSVAISSDGKSVYATVENGGIVTIFNRDVDTGTLTYSGKVQNGSNGITGLAKVRGVTVSPDGKSVYAVGSEDDAIVTFSRNTTTGDLTYVATLKDGVGGVDGLDQATFVTVAPDGKSVYVAGKTDNAVAVFSRNEATGALTYVESIKDGQGQVTNLLAANSVSVSPDGKSVYVTAGGDDAISIFARDPQTSRLTYVGAVRDGVNGVTGLDGASSVTVTPDGELVYATSRDGNALTMFARDTTTGALTFVKALVDNAGGGNKLQGATSVVVSPDGDFAYVSSLFENAVTTFELKRPIFTEDGSALTLLPNVTITDNDDATLKQITVTLSATPDGAAESLSATGLPAGITANYDPTTRTLTLSGTASVANYQKALRLVEYTNSSNEPTVTDRSFTTIVTDMGDLSSNSVTQSFSVVSVNDAPTLTSTATSAATGLAGSGTAISLFHDTAIATVEASQGVKSLTLTVTGVADGASEFLTIQGSDVALTNGNAVTAGGYSYAVTLTNGTATVTVTPASSATTSAMASLIDGITYKSTGQAGGHRTVTITGLTDDGGTAHGGHDTASLSIAATVSLMTNPVVSNAGTDTVSYRGYLQTSGFIADALGMSPDGKSVYATNRDGVLEVYSRNTDTGALTYVSNLRQDEENPNGVNGLISATAVGVSADGKSAYVTSLTGKIAIFNRDTGTGALTYAGFVMNGQNGVSGISSPMNITSSADNKFVYVAGNDGKLVTFSRNTTTGSLTYLGKLEDGVGGVDGLAGANSVKLSPDGKSVYVTGNGDNAVAFFSRDASTGTLTYVGSIKDGVGGADGLNHPQDVAVSPDGQFVYVTSSGDDAISIFARNASTGALSYVGIVRNGENGVSGLDGASKLVVTPDGKSVMAGGILDASLVQFDRNATTGALTFVKKLVDGVDGVDKLQQPGSVLVSPDGKSAYVASGLYAFLTTFSIDHASSGAAYTEDGGAVALLPNAVLSDADSTTLKRATITLSATPDGAAESLSATGLPGGITAAYDATTRTLTLSGNATVADYQAALRLVKYDNSSNEPTTTDRSFTVTVTDTDDLSSDALTSTLTVTAANDAPTLTASANADVKALAGSGMAVSLFHDTAISTVEAGQSLKGLTLTVGGVTDGTKEFLTINGSDVALSNGNTQTANGYSYAVTLANGTATVTVTASSSATASTMASLIDGITYKSTGVDAGTRTVTITGLQDDGGTAHGGHDTASLSITTDVTLMGKPVVSNPGIQGVTYVGHAEASGSAHAAYRLTMSPDGKSVYAVGPGIVDVYSRNPDTNALTYVSSLQEGVGGVDGLRQAQGATVSADGHSVYVTNILGSIATFNRDSATGTLTYAGIINNSTNGVTGLTYPTGITNSPDGKFVYVADTSGSLFTFSRDVTTGSLTFVGKLQDDVGGIDGLSGARDVAISPDGKSLFVTGQYENAFTFFNRDASTGALTYVGSIKNGVGGADGLTQPQGLTVSPDGRFVYVASPDDDAISIFSRDATTGAMTYVGVVRDGQDGAGDLDSFSRLTVSPDGRSVVAVSSSNHSLVLFDRDTTTGALTFAKKLVDGVDGIDKLGGPGHVLVSPDGKFVYVAAAHDKVVASFSLSELPATATAYTEDGGAVALLPNAVLSDADSTDLKRITVTLTATPDGAAESLSATGLPGGITAAYDATTRTLTLSGNATVADYQAALRLVKYANTSNEPTTTNRDFTVTVTDTDNLSSAALNATLTVTAVNDAPTLTATANADAKTPAGSGTAVSLFHDTAISTVEAGQGVKGLTLTVGGVTDGTKEFLTINGSDIALSNGNTLTANGYSYAVTLANGTATVTATPASSATASAMASLIDGITYKNTGAESGTRAVTITGVQDDGGTAHGGHDTASLSLATNVTLMAKPVVTAPGAMSYTENDNPLSLAPNVVISDSDSTTLKQVTVALSATPDGTAESLSAANLPGGIAAAYDATTRTLTLSGTASVADYQEALRLVKYANSSENPSTADRTFTIIVTDAQDNSSAPITGSLLVEAVNDTPTLTAPGTIIFTDTAAADSFTSQGGTLVANDVDGDRLTFGISSGQAATHTAEGVSYDLSKTGTYGTLYLNSSTGAYLYVPSSSAIQALKTTQTESFTLNVTDGVITTPVSKTLTITANGVNDTPVMTSAATASVFENATAVTTVRATDADGDSITYSIADGADGALFTIDATTGVLSFTKAPDFENKADADKDGIYQVAVQASDGALSSTQTISVTVVDINDAPTLISTAIPAASVAANTPDPSTHLFSASSISTVDAGQLLTSLTLTVGGVSDGDQEILTIGGQAVALTNGNSVGGSGKPTIAVSVNNGLASVTVHFAQGISPADLASLVDGITYANQLPSAGGSRTITLTSLQDNGGTANNGQDTANLAIATTITIQPDVTPPDTPVITSAALTNQASPTLTGTAEAGSSLTISVAGAQYSATTGLDGRWSLDLSSARPASGTLALNSNGSNAVQVIATDAAGNSSNPGSQQLVIDTTAPGAPVITSAALTNQASPTLTGTAEAGSSLTISVGGAQYSAATGLDGRWSLDLSSARPASGTLALNSNGSNAVQVIATDAAGNSSNPGSQQLVIDTTAPAITAAGFVTPQMQVGATGNVAFTINGGEAGATYSWTITSSSGGSVSGTGVMSGQDAQVSGINLGSFGEGTLTLSVTLTDQAGNRGPVATGTAAILQPTPGPITPEPQSLIDGAKVTGSTDTRPDGSTTTKVVIEAPTPDRRDDPSTPNSTAADIPVVREQVINPQTGQMQTVTTLMVSVPTGVSVTSSGPSSRTDPGRSLLELIREIEARTTADDRSRIDLSGGGTGFLSSIGGDTKLLVRSLDIGGAGGTTSVTGNSAAEDQPIALVLDTSHAQGPVTIQLDNVAFAAVIGTSTIVGGAGSQVVYGDNASQTMILGPGDDELHGGGGNDTVASTLGDDSLFGDAGDDVLHGGVGDDWLLGGADNDLIGGGEGNDRGFGGTGNDILFGEAGNDVLSGDEGNDTIDGGSGNDTLFGGDGNDWLYGGSDADTLSGGTGDDTGLGGDGDDLIGLGDGNDLGLGGHGNDTMFGEAGNDVLSGEAGNDTIDGGSGNDTLFGGDGNDWLYGGSGADTLSAGTGDDTVLGGDGDDLINGGAGNDLIFADGGRDTIWGGEGRDTFALGATSGGTVIADFEIGIDHLALYDSRVNLGTVIATARVVDGSTLLDMGDGQIVTILGRTGDVASWFLVPEGA